MRISTDFWASLKSAGSRSEHAGCTGDLKRIRRSTTAKTEFTEPIKNALHNSEQLKRIKSSKRRSYTRARVLHSFRQSGKAEADQEQEHTRCIASDQSTPAEVLETEHRQQIRSKAAEALQSRAPARRTGVKQAFNSFNLLNGV